MSRTARVVPARTRPWAPEPCLPPLRRPAQAPVSLPLAGRALLCVRRLDRMSQAPKGHPFIESVPLAPFCKRATYGNGLAWRV